MRLPLFAACLAATAAIAPTTVLAQPRPAEQTIRFPGYDPQLGSLTGYRAALITAVDRHIAAIEAGYQGAWEVEGLQVAPSPYARPGTPLPPALSGRGSVAEGTGVNAGDFPSANRTGR